MLVVLDVSGIEFWDGEIGAFYVSVEIRLIPCLHLINLTLDSSSKDFLLVVFGFTLCFHNGTLPYVSEVNKPNNRTLSTPTPITQEPLEPYDWKSKLKKSILFTILRDHCPTLLLLQTCILHWTSSRQTTSAHKTRHLNQANAANMTIDSIRSYLLIPSKNYQLIEVSVLCCIFSLLFSMDINILSDRNPTIPAVSSDPLGSLHYNPRQLSILDSPLS